MSIDTSRRHELLAAKLAGLVRARWGDEAAKGERGPFLGGATLRAGDRGWVLADEQPERALGGAMAWGQHRGVKELHVLAAAAAGVLARRSRLFVDGPTVWDVQGTELVEAEPEEFPDEREIPEEADVFLEDFEIAGVEPVEEHGVLMAEVLGLEVARVVEDVDGEVRLEVGVGKHDRDAHRHMHSAEDPRQALVRTAELIRRLRAPGAPPQPANQLAPERWLRCVVVGNPALVDAAYLEPVSPALPRPDLRTPSPAPAVGSDLDGCPVVVVCSTGMDPELVPAAADVRARAAAAAPLVVVVPQGDDHSITHELVARLREPARIVTVAPEWKRLG